MKKLTEVLNFEGYEKGVKVDIFDYKNNLKLIIENCKFRIEKNNNILLYKDINNISNAKSLLEAYIRLIDLYNKEKRKIEKLLYKADMQKENYFIKEWGEIKDLRTKLANELKIKTIQKLEEISKRLENETNFTWFNLPKNIYYYNYGKDSGAYDERVDIVWTREWGYIFEVEEYNTIKWEGRKEYSDDENTEFESITTGDIVDFNEMNKKTIRKIARYINDFEFNITTNLNDYLVEEKTLLNSIK